VLQISNLTYRIGGRAILDGATAAVPDRTRAALIGRNGAGKTTLLKLIAGALQSDGGSVSVHARARVGTLAQQAPDGPESLLETVLAADTERTALLAEADDASDPTRIGEVHARLAEIGSHAAPARAAEILAGLGFPAEAQQGSCAALSGGWRMRVALAAVLFARPDLLLLDEPTNHLDFEATLWLETFLARYPGTMIIVSHDRDLLDTVAERTLHLENGKLTAYTGNYSQFERTLRERRKAAARADAALSAQRARMMEFVRRFRAKATKARQAQSRLKALERLGPIEPVIESRPIVFDFPEPEPLPPPLITLAGTTVGYGGEPVLRGLDLRIDMDDRIAILGANGNGKSTLARLLAGSLKPEAGRLHRHNKLRIGYFDQHQTEALVAERTAFGHMLAIEPDTLETRLRAHLGRFGFTQAHADVPVSALSGGEKARLLFALATRAAPHMLILDEPTNHLDIESREALAQALNTYDGAVILISHDPHLIGLVADRLWLVEGGNCRPFEGDLDDYRRHVLEERREARRADRGARPNGRPSARDRRRAAAEARQALAPLRRAVRDAESEVERLTAEKAEIEARLADDAVYDGPDTVLKDLMRRRGEIAKALQAAERSWLAAHESLESAESTDGLTPS
jgi:ATP-binding cassette subfamily F protein 3